MMKESRPPLVINPSVCVMSKKGSVVTINHDVHISKNHYGFDSFSIVEKQ